MRLSLDRSRLVDIESTPGLVFMSRSWPHGHCGKAMINHGYDPWMSVILRNATLRPACASSKRQGTLINHLNAGPARLIALSGTVAASGDLRHVRLGRRGSG